MTDSAQAAEATALTEPGMVIGSPGFMSPEQAQGGIIGPASDVFNLGAVLTFAATGEGPFGTGSTPALLYRVVHSQPDIFRVPVQVRSLVGRCLAKNPVARPTAGDLLAELGTPQFASDWLPASVAEALGRYGAQDHGPADASERPTTTGPAGPLQPGAHPAGPLQPGTHPAPGGRPAGGRRRLIVLAAVAAAVIVAGSAATAVALSSGTGAPRAAAISSSHPAVRPSTSAPSSSPSSGPATSAVPAVLGDTLSAGASVLKKKGFENLPYLYGCYASGDYGDIVRQDPAAGTVIALTAPVHLFVQANNCRRVPDVGGLTLSAAEYQLKHAGFSNIQYMYRCYGSSHRNEVVHQSPGPGRSYGSTQPVAINLQADNC